jgi:hypothetical protein
MLRILANISLGSGDWFMGTEQWSGYDGDLRRRTEQKSQDVDIGHRSNVSLIIDHHALVVLQKG